MTTRDDDPKNLQERLESRARSTTCGTQPIRVRSEKCAENASPRRAVPRTSAGVQSMAPTRAHAAKTPAGNSRIPAITYNGSRVPGRKRLATMAPAAWRSSQERSSQKRSVLKLPTDPGPCENGAPEQAAGSPEPDIADEDAERAGKNPGRRADFAALDQQSRRDARQVFRNECAEQERREDQHDQAAPARASLGRAQAAV